VPTATRTRATALNQMIAVRKGVQAETNAAFIKVFNTVQKVQLLTGLSRVHRKVRDEDPDVPGESQRVQVRAADSLLEVRDLLARRWDVTAAIDWTNCEAKANVVVGDTVLIEQAPTSFLLFLEKQLTELHEFVSKLPVLDPAEEWHWDDNADAWASATTTTSRTKKEWRTHMLAPATDRHPAQVKEYTEDVTVGYWDLIKFSGAIDGARRKVLLGRLRELKDAVTVAREQANMTDVIDPKPAGQVLTWLLRH
jgi:hypothetical protein